MAATNHNSLMAPIMQCGRNKLCDDLSNKMHMLSHNQSGEVWMCAWGDWDWMELVCTRKK